MSKEGEVDEALYSRQIYVLGMGAMKRLNSASVLISGLGGLGVEIAKNIILAGVRCVTLHDTKDATLEDLASQFYITEDCIGQNRALVSKDKLAQLNDYVTVTASNEPLTNSFLEQFDVVCLTDMHSFSEFQRISDYCHSVGKKFIACDTRGVFGFAFNDFGEEFLVLDPTGEEPSRFLLSCISRDEDGIVTLAEDQHHNLQDGDTVTFDEVEGMTELNGVEFKVSNVKPKSFQIGNTSEFSEYTSVHTRGYGQQIVKPIPIRFSTFIESLSNPAIQFFDLCDFDRDRQVMLLFLAFFKYTDMHPENPFEIPLDDFKQLLKDINDQYQIFGDVPDELIGHFLKGLQSVISPTCAALGGIVGQEVLKAITGKFSPLNQYLCFGYVESIPPESSFTLVNDRYDPYRRVFGDALFEKMTKLKYFMIGAGALGCELLKNWALMGVATEGEVIVTDMDTIERSNLSRQFLFRNTDIGQSKSQTAAKAVKQMNPQFKCTPHMNMLCDDTLTLYNDAFYESLSGVCNALDNLAARQFSDKQCVYYKVPLLESGTLGPKCHYQIIIPRMTESYNDQRDPNEKSIPFCTVHQFPFKIDHCCIWARELFSEFFERGPESVNRFIKEDDFVDQVIRTDPGELVNVVDRIEKLLKNKPSSFVECAQWARIQFERLFFNGIADLIHKFPEDATTSEGIPIWTGEKRFPSPMHFDPTDEHHRAFIITASTLYARMFGILPEGDPVAIASECPVPEYKYTEPAKEGEGNVVDMETLRAKALGYQSLRSSALLNPESFEKDDDSNGHIDFITAVANLRGINYRIATCDKLEVKRITGNIIPAIATTTAMVCGFVCLEMLKVHSTVPLPIEKFRCGFINLALPQFILSEPKECARIPNHGLGRSYTTWDMITIKGDLTVAQLAKAMKKRYGLDLETLTTENRIVYSTLLMPKDQCKANFKRKISDLRVDVAKAKPLGEGQYYIKVTLGLLDNDLNSTDVTIRLDLRTK